MSAYILWLLLVLVPYGPPANLPGSESRVVTRGRSEVVVEKSPNLCYTQPRGYASADGQASWWQVDWYYSVRPCPAVPIK